MHTDRVDLGTSRDTHSRQQQEVPSQPRGTCNMSVDANDADPHQVKSVRLLPSESDCSELLPFATLLPIHAAAGLRRARAVEEQRATKDEERGQQQRLECRRGGIAAPQRGEEDGEGEREETRDGHLSMVHRT